MKTIRKATEHTTFKNVEPGSIFLHGEQVYIKIKKQEGYSYEFNAIDIEDGSCDFIDYELDVIIPFSAHLTVKK